MNSNNKKPNIFLSKNGLEMDGRGFPIIKIIDKIDKEESHYSGGGKVNFKSVFNKKLGRIEELVAYDPKSGEVFGTCDPTLIENINESNK